MDSFVVSARKYRPESFDTVVGQEHVTRTLINEIKNNQLAQAFLFNGPRGVGKTTCARILAKEINKESIEDKSYDYSYNIFELDAASNNSVEDIRLLNEQVRIPPQVGKYKVYIIDEVHMLSASAFNAFLKTLEEPPAYAIFILATTERHKILPTILSRCQVFTFNRISVADTIKHLKGIGASEDLVMEDEALHVIAQKADGALRDALSIFDQMVSISGDKHIRYADVVKNLNVLDYDYYFKITDAFSTQNVGDVLLVFDEILSNGFDGQIFLNGLANHFRDLMVGRNPETVKLLDVPPHMHQRYLDCAKTMSQGFLVNAINIANQFDLGYKASRNQRLHVELALIKICYLPSLLNSGEKKKSSQSITIKKVPSSQYAKTNGVNEEIPKAIQEDIAEVVKEIVQSPEEQKIIEPGKQEIVKSPAVAVEKPKPKSIKKNTLSDDVAKLGNLEDLLNGSSKTEKEDDQVEREKTIEIESGREITQSGVNKAVDAFVAKLKKEERVIQVSLFTFITPVLEDDEIVIKLVKQHRIQLEDMKVELLQHLRATLANSSLQIEIKEVKKKAEGTRAYTGQEKFEVMAKKNPALLSLKEKLNLTIK
ncbi:MAG: DNA polymerase-3 subunit gamma/tau [Bacteroidia bacterium]|jgi:DNA polymerase-3 subunit gamma/tau